MTTRQRAVQGRLLDNRHRVGGEIPAARCLLSGPNAAGEWPLLRLSNGLRLILAARPGTPTVAVRAYVRAGSRYDAEHCLPGSGQPGLGLAHLTEHLLFKGTRTRSQRQLFTAIERLGGTLEAGTAKEYLCVSTVVPPAGLALALEIVAEILGQPSLDAEDFGNEKLVILAEKLRAQDREARILDLFAEALWQEHPLSHPAPGTLAGLQAVDPDSLLAFYRQRFVGGNIVLVLCGAFEPQAAESLAVGYFGTLPAGPEQPPAPFCEPPPAAPRATHLERDLHQASLLLGVPTVSMGHPDRSALKVIERDAAEFEESVVTARHHAASAHAPSGCPASSVRVIPLVETRQRPAVVAAPGPGGRPGLQ